MKAYDVIIIGGGGSGLAAAMYSARLGLKSLVLGNSEGPELPVGGVITTTNIVENYPGFSKITGMELAKRLEEHARSYDLTEIKEEKASSIEKLKSCFKVKTKKSEYKSKAIIFATGTKWRKLNIPGSKEFEMKGINYCALCDAPIYKNKIVGVVGGSDSAAKEALILAQHAKKVYIIYRGEKISPEPINLQRVNTNKKIEVINNTNIIEVKGDKMVNKVILDKKYRGSKELNLDGLFIAIGHIVLSELAKTLGVKINKKGEVIIDHATSKTNVRGVFAAGDITNKPFKQLIMGVSEGCTAAYSAYEFIKNEEIKTCD